MFSHALLNAILTVVILKGTHPLPGNMLVYKALFMRIIVRKIIFKIDMKTRLKVGKVCVHEREGKER